MRSVPLWIGKTDDSRVPPRVRARVFVREDGRCWLSGRKIMVGEAWELEHKVALCNGGSHSEDNLAPALVKPHKTKTASDVAIKSKVARIRNKHIGIRKPSTFACSKDSPWRKKINGQVERR